jgi:hypothetical protein
LLKLLSVRVKAASDPAWPIVFDPGLGSFYAGKPVKLLLRAFRPYHNDETAAGLRWNAEQQDEILMLLRLDRALLELFAVRGRNITAYSTAKAKYGLS